MVESVQTWSSLTHRACVLHLFSSLVDFGIKGIDSFIIMIPPGRDIGAWRRAYLETSDLSSPKTLGLICI